MLTCPQHWLSERIRICLIGLGGTGSALLDGLCALDATLRQLGHPGFSIVCHDADSVSLSNVGRQRYTHADVGLPKCTVICHRMGLFYGTDVTAIPQHFGPRTRQRDADLYITATDSASLRASFPMWLRHSRALWADTGNGERVAQLVVGHLHESPHQPYIPNVLDLFPELTDPEFQASQKDVPTCSAEEALRAQSFPINRAIAGHTIDLLWELIRHGSARHHGVLCSVAPPSVSLIEATPAMWAQFGWQAPSSRKCRMQRAA